MKGTCKRGSQCGLQHIEQDENSKSLELLTTTSACSPVNPVCVDDIESGVGKWVNNQLDDDWPDAATDEPVAPNPKKPGQISTESDLVAPSQVNSMPVPQQQTINPPVQQYPHISELKLHWSQFADPWANGGIPFCKMHAQGFCKNGDTCYYRHSLTVSEYTSLFHDTQPLLVTLRKEPDPSISVAIHQVIPQPMVAPPSLLVPIHPEPSTVVQPSRISKVECTFYSRGKCKNDPCPYQHSQHPPPEVYDSPFPNSTQNRTTSQSQRRTNKPCLFFSRYGYCREGEHCKFSHGTSSGYQSIAEPDTEEYMENWENKDDDSNNTEANHDNAQKSSDGWGDVWGDVQDSISWNAPQDATCWDVAGDDTTIKPDLVHYSGTNSKRRRPYSRKGNYRRGTSHNFNKDHYDQKVGLRNHEKADASYHLADDEENSNFITSSALDPDTSLVQSDSDNTREVDAEGKVQDLGDTERSSSNPPEIPLSADGDGWDENWSKPQEVISILPTTKINGPCKAFGQGYCKWETDCTYLHIDPYDDVPSSKRDSPQDEVSICPPALYQFSEKKDRQKTFPRSPLKIKFLQAIIQQRLRRKNSKDLMIQPNSNRSSVLSFVID